MRFRALIQSSGKTAAGIQVPDEVVEGLGAGRKPPVRVTIAGHSYRSSIAVMSGVYMVGVNSDFRRESGVAAGDIVDVDIEVDTEPREIVVPPDLTAALDADPEARAFFDGLSYSNKRRIVEPIVAAKAPETRQRRIERSVAGLHDHRI
jgi:hypothetical protein